MKSSPGHFSKIKLGTGRDIEIVHALREVTDAPFRVDANASWSLQQLREFAPLLRELNVEFIEQPLPAAALADMRGVKQELCLPVIADESCQTEEDVLPCADTIHGVNIKLMKCGGITPALRMIQTARTRGLKVIAGCMTESSVGISALAQLAPLLDFIDADGALLLAKDLAEGVQFDYGKIRWAKGAGSGVKMSSKI